MATDLSDEQQPHHSRAALAAAACFLAAARLAPVAALSSSTAFSCASFRRVSNSSQVARASPDLAWQGRRVTQSSGQTPWSASVQL